MLVSRKSFVGLLSVALAISACSQAPKQMSEPHATLSPQFGTRNNDAAYYALVSQQNDFIYVTGKMVRSNLDSSAAYAFLRCYTPSGSLIWKKTFNRSSDEELRGLAEDSQGDIVVAVTSNGGSYYGTSEIFKYTPAGQELWRRPLVSVRAVFSVDTTSMGAFYIVGDDSNFRSLIRKYDQNGKLLWSKSFALDDLSGPSATDAAGNLYTVGNDSLDVFKFNQAGALVWKRSVPTGTADYVFVADLEISENALLILGDKQWVLKDTEYEYEIENDVLVASYNLNGKQNWLRTFGSKEYDRFNRY